MVLGKDSQEAVPMALSIRLWLKLRATWFKSWSGRMFVIEVVYSAPNCSKAGVCNDAYGTVHYTEPLKLFDKCRA